MIKCPVCKEYHSVPDNYDNEEFVCVRGKTFQDKIPTDLLTRSGYNWNRHSTKVDENRAATILVRGPSRKPSGDKMGTLKKNW